MKRKYWIRNSLIIINVLIVVSIFISARSVNFNPNDNSWIPFFGLAFPVLLLLNIGFILYWAWRKTRWYILSLIALTLTFGTISNFFQINFFEKPTAENVDFNLMTFNVRLFGLYSENNTEIRGEIFDYLKEASADILCFQEFYHTDFKNGFITKDSLLQIQDAKYIHDEYTHKFRHKQYFGVATLSKYPIINEGSIPFDGDINNICIYSDILLPSTDTIRVYNVHLSSIRFEKEDYDFISGDSEKVDNTSDIQGTKRIVGRLQTAFEKRADQIAIVLDKINESPYPTLLAGDFNDTPISYCYNQVSKYLDDSFLERGEGIGNTYNGSFPSFRIDYVFHDKALNCLDFEVDREDLSDHFPVVASFSVGQK